MPYYGEYLVPAFRSVFGDFVKNLHEKITDNVIERASHSGFETVASPCKIRHDIDTDVQDPFTLFNMSPDFYPVPARI